MDQEQGKPKEWREGLVGRIIRYRWSPDVAWRLGLVMPDRDAEDSCLGCCIRVADFTDFGLSRSQGLRFAYPRDHGAIEWMKGAAIELTEVSPEPYLDESKRA